MRILSSFAKIRKKLTLSKQENTQQLAPNEIEFLPAALEVMEMPPSPVGRAITWLLITIFTIAVIWVIVGQVDEVAIASGKIIPSGYTKTIQAEDKGVVKNIHVKDGTKVQAGDILIELDTTFTQADLLRLVKEQAYYKLEINRLIAEQTGRPFIPEQNAAIDPEDIQYQLQLYHSRNAEYRAKIATAEQTVQQARAALEIAEATKQKLAMQLEIAGDKESKIQELVAQGAVSVFSYQDYKERRITYQQDLAAQTTEIVKARHAILQSLETINNLIQEHDRDIMTKLVEDRRQLQSIEEELKKAKEKNRLSTITAPIAGTVQQLAIHTIGGVVTPAQVLMMIVPDGTKMEIEAWIANKDIGFVHEGQEAEIKVETFNFQKFGTLEALVAELSTDAIEDKDKGLLYRAVCKTDQEYVMVNDRRVNLAPGMAVTAEIKTRKKRIIEYFLDPFIKYKSEGLRER